MKPNTIVALQSLLIGLMVINTDMEMPAQVKAIVVAVIAGLMFYVNHVGNQTTPPEVRALLTDAQRQVLAKTKLPPDEAQPHA